MLIVTPKTQEVNLMAIHRLSIFQHLPEFNKRSRTLLFPALLFSLYMTILWINIPPLQDVLNTTGRALLRSYGVWDGEFLSR